MKSMVGTVIGTNMVKTMKVVVERKWRHPVYKKIVKKSKKYLVSNDLDVNLGDKVRIEETRPISKRKRWKITEKLTKTTESKKKEHP